MNKPQLARIVLMVLHPGEVRLDVGPPEGTHLRLMHMANFIVIEDPDTKELVIMKERYESGLLNTVISYQEMFEHALRHVRMCKAAVIRGTTDPWIKP